MGRTSKEKRSFTTWCNKA